MKIEKVDFYEPCPFCYVIPKIKEIEVEGFPTKYVIACENQECFIMPTTGRFFNRREVFLHWNTRGN